MVKPIPEGLTAVTPALTIDGCAEAIEFYKKAFGAVLVVHAPDPSGKKIWHAQISIDGAAIFLNDAFPEMGAGPTQSSLWLYSADVDAAFKRAVDAGAQVRMPPADMFWGDRMAAVGDRWGNRWTLAQRIKEPSPEEMKRASEQAAAEWRQQSKPK
ncbi:MAG: VOC family protein [Myxococcales bacterium]|nr:VOC family protein [Myxococcales bacterium]